MADDTNALLDAIQASIECNSGTVPACEHCDAEVRPERDTFGIVLHVYHDDDCPFYRALRGNRASRRTKK
ncbi:hypothetical protein GU243_08275 [Pseudarthrobacter psychrotolerans]|uniref:Uncharacterized protein n=1 Tax=Pseudarthrobacter psychrotolerans TaxID=2697569 RepID=A0A6P1NMH0_9MICC|nr:hypothetical protein [Pseudarthrobacter psychrotolerans]QHK19724.1 hypothetical protein GU243_08275 [Pseudarthrobacter psychrotolerans]